MKAFVFPGQGSQRRGMGEELFPRFPRQVQEADRILGYSITRLCLEDPDDCLNLTAYTQPAIYVVSWLACLAALEDGQSADMAAGHSVGEYTALTAAGVFDFELGLRIVVERARLMAAIEGGGLAAVIDCDERQVERLIADAGVPGLEIANINSPRQVVVGAPRAALADFVRHCAGVERRVVPLRVSGPFHTSMMATAAQAFRTFLDAQQAAFRDPRFPVYANLDAQPHRRDALAETLARHISHPVRWQALIENMLAQGVEHFVEIGRPAILTPMIEDIRKGQTEADASPQPGQAPSASLERASYRSGQTKPSQIQPEPSEYAATEDRFGCQRPLLAGPLPLAAASVELLGALSRHGALAILDSEGTALEELSQLLERLAGQPGLRGRFALALNPDLPLAPLLGLLARHAVHGLLVPGELLGSPLFAGLSRHPARPPLLLASVRDEGALALAWPCADAIYVEIGGPEGSGAELPLLSTALHRRNTPLQGDGAKGKGPLVGVGGIVGTPANAQGMRELGVDFVVSGAAFLATRESGLPEATRQALRRVGMAQHRLLPDGRFPEFASRSAAYVLASDAAERAERRQARYLQAPAAQPADGADAELVPGDASLWMFNNWLAGRPGSASAHLPTTAELVDWLCPTHP